MKILIACEESQTVCKVFREKGHEAYSCDIEPCSGGYPEWHIHDDVIKHINKNWDMIIAFPPCTHLAVSGAPSFRHKKMQPSLFSKKDIQQEAIEFFMLFVNADCPKIAIENPVGIMSNHYRPPDQYIQPYEFGEPHSKKTGLWLKNLPKLVSTKLVKPSMYIYESNGKKDPTWHVESLKLKPKERAKFRSKTYQGIANAMAEQWG